MGTRRVWTHELSIQRINALGVLAINYIDEASGTVYLRLRSFLESGDRHWLIPINLPNQNPMVVHLPFYMDLQDIRANLRGPDGDRNHLTNASQH